MHSKELQIKSDLDNLIKEYEDELTILHNRDMTRFDPSILPPTMQKRWVRACKKCWCVQPNGYFPRNWQQSKCRPSNWKERWEEMREGRYIAAPILIPGCSP